jgi:hypothetical protein
MAKNKSWKNSSKRLKHNDAKIQKKKMSESNSISLAIISQIISEWNRIAD